MRIAVWQAAGLPHGREKRLPALRAAAREAAAGGADLLVAPELGLVGDMPPRSLDEVAEPSDGPGPRAVAALAAETGIAILTGYAERCTGRLYSAALLVDAGGGSLASYRRTHIRTDERPALSRGQWLTVVPFGNRRLGLLLGYDLAFPEVARGLVLSGADLLLAAGGASSGERDMLELLLPARAAENGVPLAYAAYAGEGRKVAAASRILDGRGRTLALLGAEPGQGLADLPPAPAAADLGERRPRLYQRLAMVDAVAEGAASSS